MLHRRSPFAAACLGMLVFGVVLTVLGAVLPSVIARFGLAKDAAGALLTLLSLGILVGSLVVGPVVDRHGYRGMLLGAMALIAIGIEGIAFAPSLALLRLAILAIGFGGGIVNGGTNALAADVSADGRSAGLSLLGIFFGVGAVGVPFTLGVLLGTVGYGAVLAGVGAAVVVPIGYTAATTFPRPKQEQGFPVAAGARLIREPFLILAGLLLFLQSGMEITVGGWTSTFFAEALGITARRALVFLSLYWLGMMLARLVLGTLLRRLPPARVMMSCIGVALVGCALLLGARAPMTAAAGVFLVGAGFSSAFPVVLGFVGDRFAELSGTAFSAALVMALCGGMLLPYATGVLGATQGLRTSFLLVPAALVAQSLLLAVLTRSTGARVVAVGTRA